MEYFLLTQSSEIVNPIKFIEAETTGFTPCMSHDDFAKLNDLSITYFYYSEDQEIPDILKYPTYMVSDPIKKALAMYDDSISFKGVQAFPFETKDVEKIKKYARTYWIYDVMQIDCLSPETVFLPNGEVEEIILDRRRIRNLKMFRPRGLLDNRLIVTLPIAESILRRNAYGVGVKQVQVK